VADFATEWERPEFDSVPTLAENMVYLLPGCDPLLVRKMLQQSYRDFCRRSAALRTWRRIPLVPGERAYPVAPLLSGEIDCVTRVAWAHSSIPVRGWEVRGDAPPMLVLPHWLESHCEFMVPSRVPHIVAYEQTRENVGALPTEAEPGEHPPHGNPRSVVVEAVEIPHIGEERAPREFLQRYGDALVDGALARLFPMTGKPWTDVEQARQRGVAYSNALSEARQRSQCGGPAANAGGGFALDMGSMV
jgi:hypothetical protein